MGSISTSSFRPHIMHYNTPTRPIDARRVSPLPHADAAFAQVQLGLLHRLRQGKRMIKFSSGKVGGGVTRTSEQALKSLSDRCRDRPRPVFGQPTTAFSRVRHEFFMPT